MAINFNLPDLSQTNYIAGDSNTSITGSAPANIQVGNWMFAFIASAGGVTPTGSLTPPAGWAPITSNYNTDGRWTAHCALCIKKYTGTESFNFQIAAATQDDILVILRVTGDIADVDPVTILSVHGNFDPTMAPVCPGVPTVEPTTTVVHVASQDNGFSANGVDEGQPAGTTMMFNRRSRDLSAAIRISAASEVIASPSAATPRTWTGYSEVNYYSSTFSFAINESGGAVEDPEITIVSGDDIIFVGETNASITLSNFTQPITSIEIDGVEVSNLVEVTPNVSYTFNVPNFTDGQVYSTLGLVTLVASTAGAETAEIDVTLELPADWEEIVYSTLSEDEDSLSSVIVGATIETGDIHYFNSTQITIYDDSTFSDAPDGTVITWLRKSPTHPTTPNLMIQVSVINGQTTTPQNSSVVIVMANDFSLDSTTATEL